VAVARGAVSRSYLALQPFWQHLGLCEGPRQVLGSLLPPLLLLMPASARRAQLSRAVEYCFVAANLKVAASAVVLVTTLLLREVHEAPAQAAAAAAADADASTEAMLDSSQAMMQAVSSLVSAAAAAGGATGAHSSGDAAAVAAGAGSGRAAADAVSKGVLLLLLTDELSRHVTAVKSQEVWAALAAAAPAASACAAATARTADGASIAGELRRHLLQHVLGGAASGLVYFTHKQQAGGGAAPAAAGKHVSAVTGGTPVDMAKQLLQQPLPAADKVRAAYGRLLDSLAEGGGLSSSSIQQQQDGATAAAAATPASRTALLQRCLARVNWAGYEACVGDSDRARVCITDALREAQHYQQPHLAAVLYSCMAGLAAHAALRSAAPQQQQQATAAADSPAVRAVRAALCSSQLQGRSLPALQHPAIEYEDAAVAQLLAPPALQLPQPLLGEGLRGALSLLPRRQVALAVAVWGHPLAGLPGLFEPLPCSTWRLPAVL
jgi:hypothetical protein